MIVVVSIIVSIVGIMDKSEQVNSLPGYPGTKNLCQVHQSNDLMGMLFCNFPIFSYQSGLNCFRMANFGCFATFPIFSYQSGPNLYGMANFGCFAIFPIFSYQSGLNLYGMANFGCFATFQYFPTKVV